jgi:ribosome biogenesis GTPase / thiamine phosphate phosphatase
MAKPRKQDSETDAELIDGRVIRAESSRFLVDTDEHRVPCRLRGRIRKERRGQVRNVVVGDRVRIRFTGSAPNPEAEGVIEELCERDNQISRATPDGRRREQVLMANLERVFVVMASAGPVFNPRLLDRFLVAAEHRGLDPVIVVNKWDLPEADTVQELLPPYRTAGYRLLLTSAESGLGLEELLSEMKDRVSLFLGPSGAGKSSLLGRIQPGLEIATRSISEATGKGRHTTSYTELHDLAGGGWVADSPGVREFSLWGVEERDLDRCFPEFHDHLGACRYPDCSHSHEPSCGLREAVEAEAIDSGRYESYLRILETVREGKTGF